MEDKTTEELEAERVAAEEAAKTEFEAGLEGLSDEEKTQKIAEKEEADRAALEAAKDIDYKKELEELEGAKPEKSELEKARRALFFNAQRVAQLGGDPAEVLPKPKAEVKPETDVDKVIDLKFAEREARTLSKSEDEYQLI